MAVESLHHASTDGYLSVVHLENNTNEDAEGMRDAQGKGWLMYAMLMLLRLPTPVLCGKCFSFYEEMVQKARPDSE